MPRFITTAPIAALVTFALFVAMTSLIRTEFVPQAKSENAAFEIAPVVEDVEILRADRTPERLETVDTPPPPPRIDTPVASEPQVALVSVAGAIPELPEPAIQLAKLSIQAIDRNVQPLVRIPPVVPGNASRSGHCDVRLDVSPDGQPFNVVATRCTDSVFERPTLRSVRKWKYQPRIEGGVAVAQTGLTNRVTYRLLDERGNLIPE